MPSEIKAPRAESSSSFCVVPSRSLRLDMKPAARTVIILLTYKKWYDAKCTMKSADRVAKCSIVHTFLCPAAVAANIRRMCGDWHTFPCNAKAVLIHIHTHFVSIYPIACIACVQYVWREKTRTHQRVARHVDFAGTFIEMFSLHSTALSALLFCPSLPQHPPCAQCLPVYTFPGVEMS